MPERLRARLFDRLKRRSSAAPASLFRSCAGVRSAISP